MRLTQKRNGKNVIPLLMAACGINLPYWRIDKADDLHSYLSGDAADKLSTFEDAEEQGRLVILPCKVGDTVYVEWSEGQEYSKSVVEKINIGINGQVQFLIPAYLHSHSASWYQTSDFGKTVFLTREEAEAALKGESKDV